MLRSPFSRVRRSRVFMAAGVITLGAAVLTSSAQSSLADTTPASTPVTIPVMGNIVPEPAVVQPAAGVSYTLTAGTVIRTDLSASENVADANQLALILRPSTGFAVPIVDASAPAPAGSIDLLLTGAPSHVGAEGYQLDVTASGVVISALTAEGLFHGIETLRQLLPASIESPMFLPRQHWIIGGGHIVDYPRYSYRGAMLDVSRHFMSYQDVEHYIDAISLYKINYLHLHLSDDQGWRIAINGWPNLTKVGGSTEVGGGAGGYYTQAEYRDIVAYAQAHYVTIVPEIDMPGHINAALASYPQLNCDGVSPPLYTGTNVGFSSLCLSKQVTYNFITDVMGQLAALTPGPYIHFGGDEASSTTAAEYKQFVPRVQQIINSVGKTAIGWHDITAATLSPTTIAEYWGTTHIDPAVVAATKKGTKLIMAPATRAYLDQKYTPATTYGQDWAGDISVEKAYDWDPASFINGVAPSAVLGVEAPVWTETMSTLVQVEYMAFPRLPAIAELGWSPESTHSWTGFSQRIAAQGLRWQFMGINYYASPEIAWPAPAATS